MSLKVDWCSYQAAKFAVENWHYSKRMPAGKAACIGIWENDVFIGAIVYGWGVNHNLSKSFNLCMTECYELTRIAMREHCVFVSQAMAISRKMIKEKFIKCRLLISYADPEQSHNGSIYRADNWLLIGMTEPTYVFKVDNKTLHKRSYTGKNHNNQKKQIPPGATKVTTAGKYKYAYPLDRNMRNKIKHLQIPYF